MITSAYVEKQIMKDNSISSKSSNLSLTSSPDDETVSKTPEENYRFSLAIFKNLDAEVQKTKFGSHKSKMNSEIHDPSLSSSHQDDPPPILNPCPSLRQSFTSNGKYYLCQSLYGTVRMNPLKSFPTVFNSKSLPGVASLKMEENETSDCFEDEGNLGSPAVSLNFFHGNYHQVKDNPSYLSDNEEEDDEKQKQVSTQEDLKLTSTHLNDLASDGISLTSDYDSVSTDSNSTICNGVESTLSTKESTTQSSNRPIETSNQFSKNIKADNSKNSCRFIDNNRSNNSNNDVVVETNNKTSLQTGLSKFELIADFEKVANNNNNFNIIDQKSSANFDSFPAPPSDKISPTLKIPGHATTSISNSVSALPSSKSKLLDLGLEVTTSEKGEIRVRERETLTTIRHTARSSMICKRREKLRSKAEDVGENEGDCKYIYFIYLLKYFDVLRL